jgi:serine/threonine protein kinase
MSDHYVIIKGQYPSLRKPALHITCDLLYVRLDNPPTPGTPKPSLEIVNAELIFLPVCVDITDFHAMPTPALASPTIGAESSVNAPGIGAGLIAAIAVSITLVVIGLVLVRRTRLRAHQGNEDELLTLALEKSNSSFAAKYGHANASLERLKLEFDLLQLQPSQLKLGKSLGQGRFGHRYRATYVTSQGSQEDEMTILISGSATALSANAEKDRRCQVLALDQADLQLYEEFFVMCRLHHLVSRRHPHILHYHGQVLDPARPLCVLEWTQQGTLRHYLQHSRRHARGLTLDHCMTVFRQVSSAMAHLESLGIVHRQLCVENVFVGKDHNHVKVTGFSMARDVYHSTSYISKNKRAWGDSSDDDQEAAEEASLRFAAPEALDDQLFTLKSDVYAFAVFMWETFKNGEHLHAGNSKLDVARMVRTQQHVPRPMDTVCDDWCFQLMMQASQVTASSRPSFESLFSSLWTKQASRFDAPQVVLSADATGGSTSQLQFELVRLNDELLRTVTAVAQCAVVKGLQGIKPAVVYYNPNAPSSALSKGWTAISHVLMRFQHPNVQSCMGVVKILGPLHPLTGLVFAEEEGLLDYILRVNIPEAELCRLLCVDVLAGLQHLSARAVACKQLQLDNLVVVQQRLQLRCLDAMLIKEAADCNLAAFSSFIQQLPEAMRAVERVPSYHEALKLVQSTLNNNDVNGFQRIASLLLRFEDMFSDGTSSWELDWDDLLFVKELGTGNFGQVNLMAMTTHKQSHNRFGRSSGSARGELIQELVAVKTLTDTELSSDFLQEMNMMKQLSHPNLVAMLHVITQCSEQALVLEYLELGALQEWLQSREGFLAPLQDLAFIAHQVRIYQPVGLLLALTL